MDYTGVYSMYGDVTIVVRRADRETYICTWHYFAAQSRCEPDASESRDATTVEQLVRLRTWRQVWPISIQLPKGA